MKTLKKAVAMLLAVAFIFTLSACHPKDEIAVSCGKYEITSAMYSYYLIMADSEAKSIIDSDSKIDTQAKGFKYTSQKIEGKKYTDYVEEKALERCKRYIILEKLCDEANIELDDETAEGWKSTAQYYWAYAYGSMFSLNGIAYTTYEKILLNEARYNLYFDYLYLEGGEKEMAKEDIKKNFDEHYTAAYLISHDYSKEEKPDLDKIKEELEKYKKLFEQGKDFDTVKAEYDADQKAKTESSNSTSSGSTSSNTSSDTSSNTSSNTSSTNSSDNSSTTSSEDKEEEKKPVDADIVVLTDNENTNSSVSQNFTKYSEVAKLNDGEVAIIADSDNKVVHIVVKKDINVDEYYLDTLSNEVVYMVHGEGFDKFINEEAAKLECNINNYALTQFKVSKIKEPEQ